MKASEKGSLVVLPPLLTFYDVRKAFGKRNLLAAAEPAELFLKIAIDEKIDATNPHLFGRHATIEDQSAYLEKSQD